MRAASLLLSIVLSLAACGRTSIFDPPRGSVPTLVPICGDGFVEGTEQCDDGNAVDTDACRTSCQPARCGDAVLFVGAELCDDGNLVSGDGCEADCAPPPCGNGRLDLGEQCDDGNSEDGDDCLSTCLAAFCGDLQRHLEREECDDGNAVSTDACVDCEVARCGDRLIWRGVEACDDGNQVDDDACSNTCELPVCGDGRVAGSEECDLGAAGLDRPAIQIEQDGLAPLAVRPLVDPRTVEELYDYRSASSHIGFERARESRVLLFSNSGAEGLSLILNHGVDEGAAESQPSARVRFEIDGLPAGWHISLSDDRVEELFPVDGSRARGAWGFEDNTDGGAISGIPFPGEWVITITPEFGEGIDRWVLLDGSLETRRPLALDRPLRIRAFASASACRPDCTSPRCGDRRVDGGEVCDDGNRQGGDGCSADCRRFD